MNKAEILAPVGSSKSLRAAVLSGADAVYLGIGKFNARRNAKKPDEDLNEIISYCHSRGVKVHITLNTLIKDSEIDEVKDDISRAYLAGADAFIIQDLGLAKLVRTMCPDAEMHASTQMSVGTIEGIKVLKELGFSRAVLPRELSFEEIKRICEQSPIDLEIFVHGALCMCVSGQCLLSAVLGSRSGNRGLCAQPCRLPFMVEGGSGHDLSLKDLSLIEHIPELSKMGIKSFKIEGRMKRPEYVAAAVTACKKSRDEGYSQDMQDDLQKLFSRSGFTEGYYINKRGREMFGIREKENVISADKALLDKYASLYIKEIPRYPVDFDFSAKAGNKASLKAKYADFFTEVESDCICETPQSHPITEEKISGALTKCGGTQFYSENISTDKEIDYTLPLSAINNMRRKALKDLEVQMTSFSRKISSYTPDIETPLKKSFKLYLSFDRPSQIPDDIKADLIFIPIDSDASLLSKKNFGAELPHGIFENTDTLERLIADCPTEFLLCHTLDALALARKYKKKAILSPSFNILNSISAYESQTINASAFMVSNESLLTDANKMSAPIGKGIMIYGRMALMLTRNCPIQNGKTCNECKRSSYIVDRKGISFPVLCNMGYTEILNSRPTYMADRLNELETFDFIFLRFTTESKREVKKIIKDYEDAKSPDSEFTRGLFYRGVD